MFKNPFKNSSIPVNSDVSTESKNDAAENHTAHESIADLKMPESALQYALERRSRGGWNALIRLLAAKSLQDS